VAEFVLGKQRILEIYLNVVEWGPGIYGAESACRYHNGTAARNIGRQEAARLAAILPAPLSRLDAIPGQEHLRRAVTVALTGNHPMTFLGSGGALADALAFGRISRHYGVTAYVTTSCICGNAGDPYLACRCTPEVLVAWQRRPAKHGRDHLWPRW
jgi:hypothetical protein